MKRTNSGHNEDWVGTRWANSYLGKRQLQVNEITVDFQDGTKLGALLEVISGGDKVDKLNQNPKIELQKLENLNKCLAFLKAHQIQLVNIGSQDVFKGNEKLILGLLWTIILRFEVGDADGGKNGLLLWVQRTCKGYRDVDPPNVQNFTNDWNTGLPFCAIIHHFRPDLIDYDSLSKGNALANCELAFKVAEEHLGIARLLDAEDVANNPKPDEKSIVAYVSQFFKLFAKASKNDALIKSIRNAVEVTKRHDAWIAKYDAQANQVAEFARAKNSVLIKPSTARTTDGVRAELDAFVAYMRSEKPAKQAARAEADGVASQLATSKRNNKRPPFEPAISPDTLQDTWAALEQAELDHEHLLLDKYTRFRQVDNEAAKFTGRAKSVETWADERAAVFKAGVKPGLSVSQLESELEVQNGFEARLKLYKPVMETLVAIDKVASDLGQGQSDAADAIRAKMTTLTKKMSDVEKAGTAHRAALEKALNDEREAQKLELSYLRLADGLAFEIDQLETRVKEPILVASAKDVTSMSEQVKVMRKDVATIQAKLDGEAHEAASKLKARRPQFASQLEEQKKKLQAIKTRETSLAAALAEETTRDVARDKFAAAANALAAAIDQCNASLANIQGSLPEQLAAVQKIHTRVAGPLRQDLEQVNTLSNESQKLKIVANPKTSHTFFTLQASYEQLVKAVGEQDQSINSQIMAEKALEVSPEQLKEFTEVFAFFDSNKSGEMSLAELKEACTAVGIDLPESEVESRMKAISPKMSFSVEQFITFMLAEVKTGNTIEHVLNAFSQFGDGAPRLTKEQLDSAFQTEPDLKKYVEERMPDGDYEKFTLDLFSR